jgi:hypothetical protein
MYIYSQYHPKKSTTMIFSFFPVWSELDLMRQIYWLISIPSTLIFLFLVVSSVFGSAMDADIHTDFDHSFTGGDDIPFQFLSVKNIVGFFTMFGWSGLGFISLEMHPVMVIFLSSICGFLMMLAMATLFYLMSRLAETGTLNVRNAIGRTGEVYLTIPAARKGIGKVQITVQGTLQTLDAITDDAEPLTNSSFVQVVDVIDNQILLVRKN